MAEPLILLVDDEKDITDLLEDVLCREGFSNCYILSIYNTVTSKSPKTLPHHPN